MPKVRTDTTGMSYEHTPLQPMEPMKPPSRLRQPKPDTEVPGTTKELHGFYVPGNPDVYEGELRKVLVKKEPHPLNRPVPPTLTVWLLATLVSTISFLLPYILQGSGNIAQLLNPQNLFIGTSPQELFINTGLDTTDNLTAEEYADHLKEQARNALLIGFSIAAAYLITLGAAITAMVRGNNLIAMAGFAAFLLGPIFVHTALPLFF